MKKLLQFLMTLSLAPLLFAVPCKAVISGNPVYYNGHFYYLLDGKPWVNQEAEAVGLAGHLVTINDAAENTFVWNRFGSPNTGLFIGFNDAAVEGTWVWSSGEPVTFTNWRTGEPNNSGGNEDYGELGGDYKWNDVGPLHTWRAVAEGTTLFLGRYSGTSNAYNLSTDSISASDEYIGHSGDGTFTQSGGTNTVAHGLILGLNSGANGDYNLSVGYLSADYEHIGSQGTGTFTQSDGTNITNELILGCYDGSGGSFNLSGGSLSASNEYIGDGSNGTFMQYGGTNTVYNDLILGRSNSGSFSGFSGNYELGAGYLLAWNEHIGGEGNGTFTQLGGTNTVAHELTIGKLPGANGTYNLSGGSLSASNEQIGEFGAGTLNQTGGSHTVNNNLYIEVGGIYNLSGGTLTAGNIVINDTFNYSGGGLNANITNNVSFNFTGPGTRAVIGNVTNYGNFNFTGPGTRTISGNTINYGTIKTTSTAVTFIGTFTNSGAYISDPSDNYFSDLSIQATGYLQGNTGDNFFILNDFTNLSENSLWDTHHTRLVFIDDGVDLLHNFTIGGSTYLEAFSWGILDLTANNTLNLSGLSLYVDTLILDDSSSLNLDGITLYYRDLVDNGGSINYLNGGQLLAWDGGQNPVPEPGTLLLFGSGIAGLMLFRKRFVRKV